jgi:hypothetical protein
MRKALWCFVCSLKELGRYLLGLKQMACPFCGAVETLNCHSKLYGNDPDSHQGSPTQRGQRVWCSDRGRRGGCGRSFSIYLADVLPRHTVTARWLGRLLERLLAGDSTRAAFHALRPPFPLDTLYHLLQRLRRRLPDLRTRLCRQLKPPESHQSDPLLQTAEHLQIVLGAAASAPEAFQLRFQHPLMG